MSDNESFMGSKPFAIGCSCLLGFIMVFMWWGESFHPEYIDWLRGFFPRLY